MRFPWLQIDADVIEAKASDLGTIIGLSRRETIGLLVDLWSWCLTRTPKDSPPDGIVRDSRTGTGAVPMLERAGSWDGPEGKLAAALEDVGLIERIPDGIRFRGIGRYKATWEKNRRRKGSDAEPEQNRSGSVGGPSRKTQTYTQKETTTSPATAGAVSDGVDDLPDATDDAVPDERPMLTLAYAEPDKPEPKKPKASKPKPPAEPRGDPRHKPLTDALVAADAEVTGKPYGHRGGRDARAVSECLALADQDAATSGERAHFEVLRRWRIARRWRGFPACNSLSDLSANWNAYAREQAASGPVNLRAPVRAETQPQYDPSKPSCVTLTGRDAI